MAEIDDLMQAARVEAGGRAMTTEPEPERWATFQSAPEEEPEAPEVVPGMDDASRWAAGLEADERGAIQDAFGVRAVLDVAKNAAGTAMEEEDVEVGDTGEEPPPEWEDWMKEEGGEFAQELATVGPALLVAKKLWNATRVGGTPVRPHAPSAWYRQLWRPTAHPQHPETIKLGQRYASGVRGVAQRAAPYAARGVKAAVRAGPTAAVGTGVLVSAWNFGRGVKKLYDDDMATDIKDHSFKYLMRPVGPRDYNPDSPQMQYLRDNPDAVEAMHAAGVLSTSMMDHLSTTTEEE